MRRRFSRRDFVVTGAAAGVAAASPRALFGRAPAVNAGGAARPIVIASANGNWWKNGGTVTCRKGVDPDEEESGVGRTH